MDALTLAAFQDLAWAVAGGFMALIGGAVFLYGGVRYGVIPGVKGVKLTIEKIEAASELIDAQLRHNGGSALVDKIDQINDRLKAGCPLFDDDAFCPRAGVAGD